MFHQPEIRPFGNDSNYEPWFLSMHHVVFHHLGCTHGVGILLNKTSWICLGWMPEFDTRVRYPMYQGFGDGTKPKLGNICHSDFIQLVTYPLPNRQFAGWWFQSTWTSQPFETTMQCSIIFPHKRSLLAISQILWLKAPFSFVHFSSPFYGNIYLLLMNTSRFLHSNFFQSCTRETRVKLVDFWIPYRKKQQRDGIIIWLG